MMQQINKRVVVLGGGLAGLAAAFQLVQRFKVTVIDKNRYLGGLASSFQYKGKPVPVHYHHVFSHDEITKRHLRYFNLDSSMVWQKIKMKIAVNGRIYNFTRPTALLKFDFLSLSARIRYGLFGAYVFTFMNPEKIPDDLDAEQWLKKYAGKEVSNKLFYQLYARNKFGIPLSEISAKQFAHRLKAKEALGYFGYPVQGLQKMIDGLETNIKKNGGEIITGYKIKHIDLNHKTIDNKIDYDILINTIPMPEFLHVASNLPKNYRKKISKIKYCPAVTVVIGTTQFLGEQYWLNILNEKAQMLMQHSRLYDGYDVKISWILRYGGAEDDLELSDEEIKTAYLETIKRYFPQVEIVWSKVFREPYASPIYDKHYPGKMPPYKTEVDGLYNAGVAVTYPKIRNMNTALESGEKVADIICKDYLH